MYKGQKDDFKVIIRAKARPAVAVHLPVLDTCNDAGVRTIEFNTKTAKWVAVATALGVSELGVWSWVANLTGRPLGVQTTQHPLPTPNSQLPTPNATTPPLTTPTGDPMRLKGAKQVHYDSGPNMTPLVDVVMVILIFLMLAGSFGGAEHYLQSKVPIRKGAGSVKSDAVPDETDFTHHRRRPGDRFSARPDGMDPLQDKPASLKAALSGQAGRVQRRRHADGQGPGDHLAQPADEVRVPDPGVRGRPGGRGPDGKVQVHQGGVRGPARLTPDGRPGGR